MAGDKKGTKAQYEMRITYVYTLLINGLNRRNIIRHCLHELNPPWDVSRRMIDYYITQALEEIKECNGYNRDIYMGLTQNRLDDLYAKAMQTRDIPTCLAVQKEIIRINGLAPSEKVDINSNVVIQNLPKELLESDDWKEYTRLRKEEIKQRKQELKDGKRS